MTHWHAKHKDGLSPGQRWADRIRNGMGSWVFVGLFAMVMALWALWNTVVLHDRGFDPYPYILLNLALSTLAGLQGAILLIAAKRQDEISAALAQHDYDTNVAAKAEIEALQQHLHDIENKKLNRILDLLGADVTDEKNG